jgi:hypothetical protein
MRIFLVIISLIVTCDLMAQSRADLEAQRKKTLEEISYVDNMLKTTAKEKS